MQRLRILSAFIQLGRFQFLLGGFLLHWLGIMIALYSGATFDPAAFLWGQIAITATQLMTHYANDYFDFAADQENKTPTRWSGGSRVLVEGKLPRLVALVAAVVLAMVALSANIVLTTTVRPGITTFCLLLLAQSLAWFYSAPPIRLHSLGAGEATTMVVVTILTPLTGFYLQTSSLTLLPFLVVVPLCCFQFAMLLSIEFPDAEGDQRANKRTIIVRYGAQTAARIYIGLILLGYLLLPLLIVAGLPFPVAAAVTLLSPLGIWQVWHVLQGDWKTPANWNSLAFYSIVLLMGTSAAEFGALAVLVGLAN